MEWKNRLYFGDNLDILRRQVPDASVDLIYLDPPFNSNANLQRPLQGKERGGIRRADHGLRGHLAVERGSRGRIQGDRGLAQGEALRSAEPE